MYDVIIVGAGPAGLTAGLYAGRARLKTKIFEKLSVGGQILLTESIDNFPGFVGGIDPRKLIKNLVNQVKELNLQIDEAQIKEIKRDSCFSPLEKAHPLRDNSLREFIVKTLNDEEFKSRTIIITTGANYKQLDIPGEERLRSKGISYCAVCDGPLFKDKDVALIGGGNKAAEEALTLARFANKVILIHRRDQLRAVKLLQEKLFKNKKIQIIWDTIPSEFQGKNKLESIKIKNVKSQKEEILKVQGAFIAIGFKPNTDFLKGLVELDENGYIITDDDMATSVRGIFAGGDCRKKSLRQVITACSEGAICAYSAYKFLEDKPH